MHEIEGVSKALGRALEKRGYTTLTPVQQAVVAEKMIGADALVSAQTGSGKTVAFGLALAPTLLGGAERFAPGDTPKGLIVAPTRELALQVKRELEWLYEQTGADIASCVGGMDMRTERRALARGAHIVVGTPGRLCDHIDRGSLDISGLNAVVLDEADEMLDMGFREDLEFILDAAPAERRTLMFSATVSPVIAKMAGRYQRDAVRITTQSERGQHVDIEYRALGVAPSDRENAIVNVLRYYEADNAIVFCGTRAAVNHMTSRFANRGFAAVALSGELSQNERSHALQAMRDGRARVCIATDVAARGIDLPNLDLVIHADLPKNRESLLHRSGRTGRAGRKGVSALIVPHNARKRTDRLLRGAGITAEWTRPPSAEDILRRDRERIIGDPLLDGPLDGDERDFAKELLSKRSPEEIAAAFLRHHQANRSAPEELLDTGPEDTPRRDRGAFTGGAWICISVGHKDNAEPRWLLPMLCRAGHITKDNIGPIRIRKKETYVELDGDCLERFLDAIGPSGKMEKSIRVRVLDGPPDAALIERDHPARKKARPDRKPRPGKRDDKGKRKTKSRDRKPPAKPRGQVKSAFDGDGKTAKPGARPLTRKKRKEPVG